MKFRLKQSDQVSGFLDRGTNVTGELEFAGTLRIDGCTGVCRAFSHDDLP